MKYRIGQENDIVKEQDFQHSIFADQYTKAMQIIDGYADEDENPENTDSLKIVGFCGDRGDGKTSCMYNVRSILDSFPYPDDYGPNRINYGKRFVKSLGFDNLIKKNFFCLDIIDPSYFDNSHNILEIFLGKLYSEFSERASKERMKEERALIHELIKDFEKVKSSLFNLHKKDENAYTELTEIRMLASAVELKGLLRTLIKDFLKFTSSNRLVIPIDDIDLNVEGAFEMCEQIRKYLSIPESIILIAVKPEQLKDVVASQFYEAMGKIPSLYPEGYFSGMALRYLAKLLPSSTRISMSQVYDFCDESLQIYKSHSYITPIRTKPIFESKTIKDGIVDLIFRKTRFLFYNSRGGVSLIIPNNLRQLNSLLGLLCKMEDLEGNEEADRDKLKRNGDAFKNYFFNIWTDSLPTKYKQQVSQWVNETAYNTLNKTIIEWLVSNCKDELERKFEIFNSGDDYVSSSTKYRNLLTRISLMRNFSYNVSIGDLFFLLGLLELDVLSPDKARMLFFIRSYYSIRLFEEYDVETHYLDHNAEDSPLVDLTKKENEEASNTQIYKADRIFDKTTWLQRMIGGSYFTFFPGELLPTDKSGLHHFDTRVINGNKPSSLPTENGVWYTLRDLLVRCKSIIANYEKEKGESQHLKESIFHPDQEEAKVIEKKLQYWEKLFRLAEFFILSISRAIRSKDISSFYNGQDTFRINSTPAYFIDFSQSTGYYIFDALAPFSNLLNPKFCYERYNDMVEEMYEFALKHEFSLLSQIIAASSQSRPHVKGDMYGKKLHRLLSDVVIRNGEVLDAMRSNIQSNKDEKNSVNGLPKLLSLYDAISKSKMSTHRYENGERHDINFDFLKPLQNFILEIIKLDESDIIKKTFTNIFDSVEENLLSTTNYQASLKDRLERNLWLIFGPGKIGTSKDIYERLSMTYPDKTENTSHTELVKATTGKKYIQYDVPKILELLLTPKEKPRLDLWLDILGIDNID